jgi:hypothetical protein
MSVSCAYGFTAIALMTMLFPAATLLFVVPLRSVSPVQRLQTGLMTRVLDGDDSLPGEVLE